MITKKSLIIAEAFALEMDKPAIDKAGPIIRGLTELSYDAIPYTADYRDEIVESTLLNTEHNDIMEQVSTNLAELVKNAYGQINRYGVGYLDCLKNAMLDHVWKRDFWDTAMAGVQIKFICIDNDFFTSLVYPQEVRNTTLSFNNIDLSDMDKVGFTQPSEEELCIWLKSNHPDINKVLEEADCDLYTAWCTLMDRQKLATLFHYNGKTFNFDQVKSLDLSLLFQMYFILTKMYGSEDPVKWLNKGSLVEYRNFVSLMWNGMSQYLIRLKAYCEILRNRTIVMVENKRPTINLVTIREGGIGAQFTYEQLQGDVVITYSEAAVRTLEENNYSLSDWVMARMLTNLGRGNKGIDNVSLMTGSEACDVNDKFVSRVREAIVENQRIMSQQAWAAATAGFVNSIEELRDLANLKEGLAGIAGERIVSAMNKEYDGKWGYHIAYNAESHPDMDIGDVIMSSGVVTAFLRAIDCVVAADILKGTEQNAREDDVIDKRKRLHLSIIDVLVKCLQAK